MLKKISLPAQLLIVAGLVFIFGRFLSSDLVRFFYTFSLLFKEILIFCLPFIIFSFIVAGILTLKKNAIVVIPIIFLSVVVSNIIVILTSYFVGKSFLPFLTGVSSSGVYSSSKGVLPFFEFKMPVLLESTHAMLAALVIGVIFTFFNLPKFETAFVRLKDYVEFLFKKFFIPFLPLYVLGFLLDIHHRGVFVSLFEHYARAFGLIIVLQFIYLFLMYFVARGFVFKKAWLAIKNALPSYLTAFSTMSSTGTIPVTLEAAEKNTNNKPLSVVSIPIFANIHLVGDGITVPILALVTLSLFLGITPGFSTFVSFALYFCLVMLGTSGVPGGGIIVIIPILKSVLGFTPEMVGVITTLYLLQDSLGTAGNVMGDGALVIIVNKLLKKLKIA